MVAIGKGGILSTLATGIGNFGVSYNFNSIAIALIVMSATVCTTDDVNCRDGEQAEWVQSTESAIVFFGAFCGQLSMGYAGDIFGRGQALAFTLAIAAVGAFFSSVLPMGAPTSIYLTIIFCRFLLGIGVGGVYPLSAAKAAEDFGTGSKVNVTAAGWTFMWQIPGTFFPWLVALFCSYSTTLTPNETWRLLLGLGTIPATIVVIVLLIELRMQEAGPNLINKNSSSSYNSSNGGIDEDLVESIQSSNGARSPSSSGVSIFDYLKQWEIQKKLLVSGGCWFIYDVATYGILLFSGEILEKMLPSTDDVSSPEEYRRVCRLNVIASVCAIPASVITVFALKKYSVRSVQIIGFLLIALAFILLILAMNFIHDSAGVFAFYVLLTCTLTGGASMTTFVMPSVLYPTHVRTTLNGISAGMGKLGAVTGAYLFGAIAAATSFSVVMGICTILTIFAAFITYALVEEGITDPFIPTEDETSYGGRMRSEDRIPSTALHPIKY